MAEEQDEQMRDEDEQDRQRIETMHLLQHL